jgi:colicin import membrane protein
MEAVMGKSVLENVDKALKDIAGKKAKDQVKALEEAAKAIAKAGKDASLDQAYQSFSAAHKACGQPKLDKKYDAVVAESAKRQQAAEAQATPVAKKTSDSSISKSASTSSDSPERRGSAEKVVVGTGKFTAPVVDEEAEKARKKAEIRARMAARNAAGTDEKLLAEINQARAEAAQARAAADQARAESAQLAKKIQQSDYKIANLKGQLADIEYTETAGKYDAGYQKLVAGQKQVAAVLGKK